MVRKISQLGAFIVLVLLVFAITCGGEGDYFGHEYTIVNKLTYDVIIYTGDGEDPTGLSPEQTNTAVGGGLSCGDHPTDLSHITKSGTVQSGERAVSENSFYTGWEYYFVQADQVVDGKEGSPVFIRRFSWDELEKLDWTVVIEPGWEQPTWGQPIHHVTVSNNLEEPIWIEIVGNDDSGEHPLWRGLTITPPWLSSGQTGIADWAVTTERPYWVITAKKKLGNSEIKKHSTVGQILFVQRYTWDELESLDWTVVIEPGYEKPR